MNSLRVCTFNLYNFAAPPMGFYDQFNTYSASEWQKKCQWIEAQLREIKPDIIAFQEVFSVANLAKLCSSVGLDFFITVDQPTTESTLFTAPIVALASRFPIDRFEPLQPMVECGIAADLNHDFQFSRTPIKATISVPHLGRLTVYALHLKSQRPIEVPLPNPMEPTQSIHDPFYLQTIQAAVQAQWLATAQRGKEAVYIMLDYLNLRARADFNPVVILGDFNEPLDSTIFHAIQDLKPERIFNLLRRLDFIPEVTRLRHQLRRFMLYDSFDLATANPLSSSSLACPATHYFNQEGHVLDYILVSQEFDGDDDHSLGAVEAHHVFNQHLQAPNLDKRLSDHAAVAIDLSLRQG